MCKSKMATEFKIPDKSLLHNDIANYSSFVLEYCYVALSERPCLC